MSGNAELVFQAGSVRDVHLHQGPPRHAAPTDDTPWLAVAWAAAVDRAAAIDLRYLHEPGTSRLDAFLVFRAQAHDRAAALGAATDLRTVLRSVPRLVSRPVTDEAELRRVLTPFAPGRDGLVEIRKRLTVARTNRGDASGPWLTAVTPLRRGQGSWEPLWAELAALPFRALLSVRLAPLGIGQGLRAHLDARANEFAWLAREGPAPTGVFSRPRPPDPFAAEAAPLLANAVSRYTDRAFQLGITLAADQPVPSMLAESLAGTISAAVPGTGFAGAAPVVVRPGDDAELVTAWRNVTAVAFQPLPVAHCQGHPPAAIGELERRLGDIADMDEAAAAFRLPRSAAVFGPVARVGRPAETV